jgi:hypothetical protein
MARANTKTWLSLGRWCQIMGINPIQFNQLYSTHVPTESYCGDAWFQYNWQKADAISREDLAYAIKQAEDKISQFVGYNLMPDWKTEEYQRTIRPISPELYSTGIQPRGTAKSITADLGYLISGGFRSSSLVIAGTAIGISDDDGDGFSENATAIFPTTVTEEEELHAYFPSRNGDDAYEIRPLKSVSIAGGWATIVMNTWDTVDPDLQEGFTVDTLDGDAPATYVTTVDIYRVYNDPSTQVQFLWESLPDYCGCGNSGCAQCERSSQYGCLTVRDERLGWFIYRPATWNSGTGQFDSAEWSLGREPEAMRLWYLSGWKNQTNPYTKLDAYWETAVAYYAVALLDRPMCGCDNFKTFVSHWQEDLAYVGNQSHSFKISPSIQDNTFGTRRGAIYAFQRAKDRAIAK